MARSKSELDASSEESGSEGDSSSVAFPGLSAQGHPMQIYANLSP